ncbi:MAG TPA: MFS transporter [Baekduia sp.]|nr:MFS transporter [Baekduia sp.]
MNRRSYLAVLSGAVLCYAALGAVLRILPGLVDDRAALGLLVGAPALTGVLSRPLGGRLADRRGPRSVVVGGALVMAAGALVPLAWSGTVPLLASRLAAGLGEGAMMAAAGLALLRLAGPARRGRALGHLGLANYAGLAVGPLLAGALGSATTVLLAGAALPLAGALLAGAPPQPTVERARTAGGGVLGAVAAPGVALLLVNVGYVALLAFGAASAGTAVVVPVFAAGVIVTRLLGASIPDRLGGRRAAVGSTALAAAGLLVVGLSTTPAVAVAGTAALAAGQGLAVPALGLLALGRVPAERQGAATGMFFAFFDAGVGAGGPAMGIVAGLTTPDGAMVASAAAVAAAGAVAYAARAAGGGAGAVRAGGLVKRIPSSVIEPKRSAIRSRG